MSYASSFAVIPKDAARKVELYELGLLSPYSPQQMILQHEVSQTIRQRYVSGRSVLSI